MINGEIISIHTTRVGGDFTQWHQLVTQFLFQSTPPVWVVTSISVFLCVAVSISIHTTRVGGDSQSFFGQAYIKSISIHTTRVGGDYSRENN